MFKDIEKEFKRKIKSLTTLFQVILIIIFVVFGDIMLIYKFKEKWWAIVTIIYISIAFLYALYGRLCYINECSSNDSFKYSVHKIAQQRRIDEMLILKNILKKYRADSKLSIKELIEHYRTYTSRNISSGNFLNYLSIVIAISSFVYSFNNINVKEDTQYLKIQNIINNFFAELIFLSIIYLIINLLVKVFKHYNGKVVLYEKLESLLCEMYFKYDDLFEDENKILLNEGYDLLKKDRTYNQKKKKLFELYKKVEKSNNFYSAVHTLKTENAIKEKFKNEGNQYTYNFFKEDINFMCRVIKDDYFINNYYYTSNKEEIFIDSYYEFLKQYLDQTKDKCDENKVNILVIGYYPIDYKDFDKLIEQVGFITLYNTDSEVKIPTGKINDEIYNQKKSIFKSQKKNLDFDEDRLFEDKSYSDISAIIINKSNIFEKYETKNMILYPNNNAKIKVPAKIVRKFNRYKVTKREIKKIQQN